MDRPVPGNLYWIPKVPRSGSLKTISSTIAMMIMVMMMMMMMMMTTTTTTTRIAKMSNQGNKVDRKCTYKNRKDRWRWTSRRKDMTLETEEYIADSTDHSIP